MFDVWKSEITYRKLNLGNNSISSASKFHFLITENHLCEFFSLKNVNIFVVCKFKWAIVSNQCNFAIINNKNWEFITFSSQQENPFSIDQIKCVKILDANFCTNNASMGLTIKLDSNFPFHCADFNRQDHCSAIFFCDLSF